MPPGSRPPLDTTFLTLIDSEVINYLLNLQGKVMNINDLPFDVFKLICDNLLPRALFSLLGVCKQWQVWVSCSWTDLSVIDSG